jgi:hypothetical protein
MRRPCKKRRLHDTHKRFVFETNGTYYQIFSGIKAFKYL